MRARQLLDRSAPPAFSPETLTVVYQAFDDAWATIANKYGPDPQSIEDGRLRLAECVLAVTRDGSSDSDQLGRLALEMMRISN